MSILSNAFERMIAARQAEARSYLALYSNDFEDFLYLLATTTTSKILELPLREAQGHIRI